MGRKPQTKAERKSERGDANDKALQDGIDAVQNAKAAGDTRHAKYILQEKGLTAAPSSVYHHLNGRQSLKEVAEGKMNVTREESNQLESAVRQAARQRRPMRMKQGEDIINARDPDAPDVKLGENWARNWVARKKLRTYTSKKLSFERNRSLAPETADMYFNHLEQIDEDYHIRPENKYGMDETPGMFGYGQAVVVVGPKGQKGQYAEQSGDRRSYTIVATICASGDRDAAPRPWVIFRAKGLSPTWHGENNSLKVT
jgi:hypothetical protein